MKKSLITLNIALACLMSAPAVFAMENNANVQPAPVVITQPAPVANEQETKTVFKKTTIDSNTEIKPSEITADNQPTIIQPKPEASRFSKALRSLWNNKIRTLAGLTITTAAIMKNNKYVAMGTGAFVCLYATGFLAIKGYNAWKNRETRKSPQKVVGSLALKEFEKDGKKSEPLFETIRKKCTKGLNATDKFLKKTPVFRNLYRPTKSIVGNFGIKPVEFAYSYATNHAYKPFVSIVKNLAIEPLTLLLGVAQFCTVKPIVGTYNFFAKKLAKKEEATVAH